jgi:formylglycine-generating enzyme
MFPRLGAHENWRLEMKKLLTTLGLAAVLAQGALAWRPAGWVFNDYPWAYESASGDWYWFNAPDVQWVVNMGSGQWAKLEDSALASGWVFYQWAFAYAQSNGAWHWINDADTQWVVNMRTAAWSRFGVSAVPAGMVRVEGSIHYDSFYIGKFEVTWKEWGDVRDWSVTNGYDLAGVGVGCDTNHPVHSVNWYDSLKWCNARSEKEGVAPVYTASGNIYRTGNHDVVGATASADGYRLPTSSEWRYAARGGILNEAFTYSGSDTLADVGWYENNSGGAPCNQFATQGTWPVGQKNANGLGIHDMSGNVMEFLFSNDAGQAGLAGGGWYSPAFACEIETGIDGWAIDRLSDRGLRVVRNAP